MGVGVHRLTLGRRGVVGPGDNVVGRLGHVAVVEQRRRSAEALAAEELLVERASLTLHVDMALAGQIAEVQVRPHARQRLPRAACSRSMASKSALKLPLPKPFAPLRWITSKNSVGRSATGRVKICSR